jgi:hypothetical protein
MRGFRVCDDIGPLPFPPGEWSKNFVFKDAIKHKIKYFHIEIL